MSTDGGVPEIEREAGFGPTTGSSGQSPSGAVSSDVVQRDVDDQAVPLKSHRRSLIIGPVAAVVVVAVVIVGIFAFNEASAALSAGSGTATITWTPAVNNGDTTGNPPQSFTGNIGGHSLSGVATFTLPTSTTSPLVGTKVASSDVQIFRYQGTRVSLVVSSGSAGGGQP